MEMDEETRREMELLQTEDAEFLKGMDELPTDESESESEDLTQFYSDEEDDNEKDDDEARANTLRNQELATGADADEASDDSEDDGEQEGNENNSDDGNDKLEVEEESDEEVADDSDKNDDDHDNEEEQEKEESVVVEEDIYGRPVIKTSDGAKKPSAYLPPHLRN